MLTMLEEMRFLFFGFYPKERLKLVIKSLFPTFRLQTTCKISLCLNGFSSSVVRTSFLSLLHLL